MIRFHNSIAKRVNDLRSAMRRSSVLGILSAAVVALTAAHSTAAGKPAVAKRPVPRVDRFGDPLPAGAVARLGSIRFRHNIPGVQSVAFSPRNEIVVSGGKDSVVRIWEASTGKPLRVLTGHRGGVTAVAFSPSGKLLATFGRDKLIVWNVPSWRMRFVKSGLISGYDRRRVQFSEDGDTVFACTGSRIYKWRSDDGTLEAKTYSRGVTAFDLHPDGKRLVAVGQEKDRVRVYNRNDLSLISSWGTEGIGRWDVDIFDDGERAAVVGGTESAEFEIWNLKTKERTKILARPERNYSAGKAIAISPKGKWIALVASSYGRHYPGGHVIIVDSQTEKIVKVLETTSFVADLAFSSDGQRLATAGLQVRLWDVQNGWKEIGTAAQLCPILDVGFEGKIKAAIHTGGALHDLQGRLLKMADTKRLNLSTYLDWGKAPIRVFTNPAGRRLICQWWRDTVTVREADGERRMLFQYRPKNRRFPKSRLIDRVSICTDGTRVLINSWLMRECRVFRTETGVELARLTIVNKNGQRARIEAAAFSPNGQLVAVGATGRDTVSLWTSDTGKQVHLLEWETPGSPHDMGLKFSPNGEYLTGFDQEVRSIYVWSARTGQLLHKFAESRALIAQDEPVFSPNSKLLAAHHQHGRRHSVRVHDIQTGKTLATIDLHAAGSTRIAFSPNNRLIAVGRRRIKICDLESGRRLFQKRLDTPDTYEVLHFSPDSRLLAVGSRHGVLSVWRFESNSTLLDVRPHRSRVRAIRFTPDARQLIGLFENRTALVWHVPRADSR